MSCHFDLCEFYNVVIGGVIIGIVTSFLFVWITTFIKQRQFKAKYKYLESIGDEFDWIAYSMQKNNGRLKEDTPNGSRVKIKVRKDRIFLYLLQSDGRMWEGEAMFKGDNTGIVAYKYYNEHEYGQREFTISNFTEGATTFDYFFLIPLNNRIYYIEKTSPDTSVVHYNYDNEIFIRPH